MEALHNEREQHNETQRALAAQLAEVAETTRRTVVMVYGQLLFWGQVVSEPTLQAQAQADLAVYAQEFGVTPSALEAWCAAQFVSVGLFESGTSYVVFGDECRIVPLRYPDVHCRW